MILRLSHLPSHRATFSIGRKLAVGLGMIPGSARTQSILGPSATAREFKVVLDNDTLYVDQAVAEALGWDPAQTPGVPLTLSGWAPNYFAIARTGSDSDSLARRTVKSGRDPKVQEILAYLKDR